MSGDECIFRMDLDSDDNIDIQFYLEITSNYNQYKLKQNKEEYILSKSPNVSSNMIPPQSSSYKKKIKKLLKEKQL